MVPTMPRARTVSLLSATVCAAAWDEAIAASNGVHLEEEPQYGAVTGPVLMGLADEIVAGTKTTEAAIAEGRAAVEAATAG